MSDVETPYLDKALKFYNFCNSEQESDAEMFIAEALKKLSARYRESGLIDQSVFAFNIALLVEAKFWRQGR